MNNVTLKNILELLKDGKRLDGRKIDEFRDIEIETNVISKAEGSARVKLGKTEVLVGVKVNLGKPYPDSPDKGVLMTGLELSPMSCSEFESGPPREKAIEISRVIDRTIREGKIIEVSKLCIEAGEKVWMVFVDVYTMNFDGNLIDAATLGAMAALMTAKLPRLENDEVIRTDLKESLPVNGLAVASTFLKVGDKIIVDPTKDEEDASVSRLAVGIKDGNIVALQMGGDLGISDKELDDILERAIKHSKKLLKYLKKK